MGEFRAGLRRCVEKGWDGHFPNTSLALRTMKNRKPVFGIFCWSFLDGDSWWEEFAQSFLLSCFFPFFGQKPCSCFAEVEGLESAHLAAGPSLVFLLDYLCPLTATPVTVFPLRLSCHLSAESLGHQLLSFWKKSGCWPPSYHLGLLNKAEWQMRHLEGLGSDPSGKGMPLCTFKRWMTIWPGKDTHFTFPLAQDWNHLPLSSVWIKW